MPSGDVYDRLASLISQLSEERSAPSFQPHVTLIGGLMGPEEDIVSKTLQLVSVVRPLMIRLTRAEYLDEYFRCLFVRMEETEEVKGANLRAREIFGRQLDPQYMPHLSLMYGRFLPSDKQGIIATLGQSLALSFVASCIHLFSTDGDPKDWCRVREYALR